MVPVVRIDSHRFENKFMNREVFRSGSVLSRFVSRPVHRFENMSKTHDKNMWRDFGWKSKDVESRFENSCCIAGCIGRSRLGSSTCCAESRMHFLCRRFTTDSPCFTVLHRATNRATNETNTSWTCSRAVCRIHPVPECQGRKEPRRTCSVGVFMSVLWFLNVLNSSWAFNFGSCLEYSSIHSLSDFVVGPANCMDMSNEDKSKYWCRRLRKLYIFSFLFLKHFHHYLLFIYNCAQYASAQEGELPSQEEVRAMFEKVRVPGWPWSTAIRAADHMGATWCHGYLIGFHHFHHFHQPSSDLPDLTLTILNRFITDS